jgi:hypothetical protein
LSRAAQFQAEVLAHYEVYEFHPVVAKLQVYCSEDLGAFYLDILKDRLYTTGAKSHARRSAQTALWTITHAMLRWMAPFLSFTAEEAWKVFGTSESIFLEEYAEIGAPDQALLAKWNRIREIRDAANKEIEAVRANGAVGSSLQANLAVTARRPPTTRCCQPGRRPEVRLHHVGHRAGPTGERAGGAGDTSKPRRTPSASAAGTGARRRRRPGASGHLRPLRQQPVRSRRSPAARLMARAPCRKAGPRAPACCPGWASPSSC